jgi:hypothetical protein
MHHAPFYHKSQHPRGQTPLQELQRLYGNDRLLTTISDMEMWRRMILIENCDNNAEEAANLRQSLSVS